MSPLTVFVCGTTGVQGGAVARSLIAGGNTVHSLTRDISSDKAKEMASLGVKLWPGDFENGEALKSAIAGTSFVFLNLVPVMTDMAASQRQADLIISVALAAGVEQIIYSSGLGTHKPERMSTWDPESMIATFLGQKADIEATVRNAGFKSWTIVRPGVLMTNYTSSKARGMGDFTTTGLLETAHREVNLMPLLSPKTMGTCVSAAMFDPVGFHTKEIDLADEKLTTTDIVKKLAETSGKDLKVRYKTDEEIEANPGIMMTAQVVTRDIGKLVDLDEVKAFGFPVNTFDEFLGENKAIVEEIFSQVP